MVSMLLDVKHNKNNEIINKLNIMVKTIMMREIIIRM